MSRTTAGALKFKEPLRIGFVPCTDSAPLIYAKESGLFEQHGLEVELKREITWSGIGDKIINGELDAAQAPAPLPFLANLGVDSDPSALISAMITSAQGSAVTISRHLLGEGVRSSDSLLDLIRQRWGKRTCTFGVPSRFSTQSFLLGKWLRSGGIDPSTQIRLVAVPAEHMFATLKLGYIDGYCAPEPWNSLAVQAGEGVCVATSPELLPMRPETVLIVRQSFATGASDKHNALIRVMMEACSFADQPENRPFLADILSQPIYVNAPRSCLAAALLGPFSFGYDRIGVGPGIVFNRYNVNEPTDENAMWLMQQVYEALNLESNQRSSRERPPILKNVFRRDIFERATSAGGLKNEASEIRADPGLVLAL